VRAATKSVVELNPDSGTGIWNFNEGWWMRAKRSPEGIAVADGRERVERTGE
jgi:hypothetical protein